MGTYQQVPKAQRENFKSWAKMAFPILGPLTQDALALDSLAAVYDDELAGVVSGLDPGAEIPNGAVDTDPEGDRLLDHAGASPIRKEDVDNFRQLIADLKGVLLTAKQKARTTNLVGVNSVLAAER